MLTLQKSKEIIISPIPKDFQESLFPSIHNGVRLYLYSIYLFIIRGLVHQYKAVGRSENLRGLGDKCFLKEKVLLIFLPKSGGV